MKMVKKILFGLVAVAAVLSLASCGIKKDDPEGIIKGTAGNYSVNYKNDTDDEYRAYKPTGLRHAGELVKVTFNKDDIDKVGTSKFGVIFGLKETASGSQRIRDFFIIGLGANGNYYLSKYTNVVDIQAKNFGAETDATGTNPKEKQYTSGTQGIATGNPLYTDSQGNLYAYIWYQVWSDGSIHVKIGDISDTSSNDKVKEWKDTLDKNKKDHEPAFKADDGVHLYYEETIPAGDTGYSAWTGENDPAPQDYAAIYARVSKTMTLNGKVNFKADFKEAEDIEPID